MKYIKTYEKLIALELDNDDLIKIMNDAMSDQKIPLIRSLLENGFNPNFNTNYPLVLRSAVKKNIELVKLFIEFNANLNLEIYKQSMLLYILENPIKSNATLTSAAKELNQLIDIIILLIKSGSEIKDDFMNELNSLRKRRNIGSTAQKLKDRIINECSEQYDKYLLNQNINKYNL